MHSIQELQAFFNNSLKQENLDLMPAELYRPISYTLSLGGKRLRPVLLLMACEMFGGPIEKAIKPAIGIEFFHNFTLLHDDIMDQAPLRRGKTSVYQKWNTNRAILSGDTMFAMAYQYIKNVDKKMLPELLDVFTQTAIKVCEGQQYDMNFESHESVTIDAYLDMIRLKTAVLLACSLKMGALIGGANESEAEQMYELGIHLGLAFQLRDDLLDVYANDQRFGKQKGGDIISGKKTYLYLKAMELANEPIKRRLAKLYNNPMANAKEKINLTIALFDELNIKHYLVSQIRKYSEIASYQLNENLREDLSKTVLNEFINKLMNRNH